MRAQGSVQVVQQRDVGGIVETAAFLEQAMLGQQLLGVLVTGFREVDLMALLVDPVVAFGVLFHRPRQVGDDVLHAQVEIGVILGLAGNDQRRARFVDQDRVHFVDDGEIQAALHALTGRVDHVVAQVVETELVVGAVGDVCRVGSLLGIMVHLRQVDADGQAEETVQAAHPLGVAGRQVVVDRNDMHALAGNGIEVGRQRADQRLAFTGAHFGDLAVVQHHAADHLDVEVAHAQGTHPGFANDRKGFGQQGIERFAIGVALAELVGLGAQGIVAQGLQGRFERVDTLDGQ
jgi:hypothetical protein